MHTTLNKQHTQPRIQDERQAVTEATIRRDALVDRAVSFGASQKDPMHIMCIMAHYRTRPVVFGEFLVINIAEDDVGRRFIGSRSRIVGEIKFSPLGGIVGVRVVDLQDNLMVCGGCFKPNARWSTFTRGFDLLETK